MIEIYVILAVIVAFVLIFKLWKRTNKPVKESEVKDDYVPMKTYTGSERSYFD